MFDFPIQFWMLQQNTQPHFFLSQKYQCDFWIRDVIVPEFSWKSLMCGELFSGLFFFFWNRSIEKNTWGSPFCFIYTYTYVYIYIYVYITVKWKKVGIRTVKNLNVTWLCPCKLSVSEPLHLLALLSLFKLLPSESVWMWTWVFT